jgi:lipocalin
LKFPALDQVKMTRIFSFLTIAISILCAVEASCPPAGFKSKPGGINISKFFSGRWYSLKQLPSFFQPEDEFYCVNTNYQIQLKSDCKMPLCDRDKIYIFTAGSSESINGTVNAKGLIGLIKTSAKLSLLARTPIYLPYWVIEAGTYSDLLSGKSTYESDQYEWAIISSGPPEVRTNNGCLPATQGFNPSGLWLYSRKPNVSEEIMSRLEALAAAKGFDVSALKAVVQEGCTYKPY